MARIRILVVDDHAVLRDGIYALLSPHDDLEVVGGGVVGVGKEGHLATQLG